MKSQFLKGPSGVDIAYIHDGSPDAPDAGTGFFWLGGLMSDMTGSKAESLAVLAAETSRPCTRFDYSGHGQSGGKFIDGTISLWLSEAAEVFTRQTTGPRILIGSSLGGWLAVLLLRQLQKEAPDHAARIKGMVLIAPAADFTQELMWARFDETTRAEIRNKGFIQEPSDYGDEPYTITHALIKDGANNLVLSEGLDVACPVRILQGEEDPDVPWEHAFRLYHALRGEDVIFSLVKHGDHRLSEPGNLLGLRKTCLELCALADESR